MTPKAELTCDGKTAARGDARRAAADTRRILKRFLLIFVPLVLTVTGITAIVYSTEVNENRAAVRETQRHAIALAVKSVRGQFTAVRSDILYLADQTLLKRWLNTGNPADRSALAEDYLDFVRHKDVYDQVRLIDERGREVIRVNANNGNPRIVPHGSLQDKQNRYYVTDALSLKRGAIYVSPFDLNVEHGVIEQPPKPMIRIATPVFDTRGDKRGIVILNYLGKRLLDEFRAIAAKTPGDLWLINAKGYWLSGPDPARDWGFMYSQHESDTFSHSFPRAWPLISNAARGGQFASGGDLFDSAAVSPAMTLQGTGNSAAVDASGAWHLVAHAPASLLAARLAASTSNLRLNYTAFTVVLGIAVWLIVYLGTRRRQAEGEAARAHGRYEELVNNLNVGVFRVRPDPDSALMEANSALVKIFRAPSREALMDVPRHKLYARKETCEASAQRLLQSGAKSDDEMEFRRFDGEIFWASVTAVKKIDEAGKEYFHGILTDITPRKRAEEARRESEALFRKLLESAPDAVVIADIRGRILLVNSQAEKWFGYDRDELPGQPVEILVPRHLRDRHAAHRTAYMTAPITRGMGIGLDLYGVRKDGNLFPVEISLSPLETNQGTIVMSVIRDVTERHASEARFRAVTEHANDAIISADARGDIIYFNKAAERCFGYAAEEVLGKALTMLIPERHREAHRQGLQRFTTTERPRVIGRSVVLEGLRRDGSEFPLELSLASWCMGDEMYFTGVIRDITERQNNEQRIMELNTSLLRHTEELESVNKELEAFSYSVSHDLRAPLRAIDGFSQILLEDYADRLDEEGRSYLERVRNGARRMGNLIDDLLKLSRVTRAEFNVEGVDLSALAVEIARELDGQAARKPDMVIAPDIHVHGDPRLLRVALYNLLDNAWKFSAKNPDARVEFGAIPRESGTVYFVRDNGVGFDVRYIDKLFNAFQRLHDAGEFPGTGIGLATVKRVVLRHGGKIWAESADGRGAAFYFTLHSR